MTRGTAAAPPAVWPQDPWFGELKNALDLIRDRPEVAARCRRGISKDPMEAPEMWDYCMPVVMTVSEDDHGQQRRRIEVATHHVLTLYAAHQQSKVATMHQPRAEGNTRSVGAATRRLYDERESPGVKARFIAIATANSVPELAGHLRHLVTLLRDEGIALDYIRLFRDIVDWHDPVPRAKVRRRWGLDFHRNPVGPACPADDSTHDSRNEE